MLAELIFPMLGLCFIMANSRATNHMFPSKSSFISYRLVTNLQVRMGNNSFLPVLSHGLAVIFLNGQRILVRNALHVPDLVAPLYNLRAHFAQPSCGFIGASGGGILVYFPTFILSVNTSKDCHSASLNTLHYVQPHCAPSLYPLELASHKASKSPAVIEDDSSMSVGSEELIWSYPQPKCPRPAQPPSPVSVADTPLPRANLNSVSTQLCSLANAVSSLMPPASTHPPNDDSCKPWSSPVLASTMSREEIISLLHRKGSSLPSVHLCDMANGLDTKPHWTAEELHRTMGCHKFCNYKTLLQVSCDGEWIDGSKFPPMLALFATIPKAKRSLPLNKTKYFYLDAVHMDIAFGDCLSVGSFKCALILVDCATHYNWTFGLKSLSSDCIL
jgi:hypothetical protein